MQIAIDRKGNSRVKLTKTEVQFLNKAKAIVGMLADHCRHDSALAALAEATDGRLRDLIAVVSDSDPVAAAGGLLEPEPKTEKKGAA